MPFSLRAASAALLLCWSASAMAQAGAEARPFLWRLADADSRVYLLGSVHALPAGTDVLPGPAADAYADAEALAFEVDLDDAPAAAAAALPLSVATDGVALSKRLGPADAARLAARLGDLGLDAAALESIEPWFVGLMIGALSAEPSGYSAAAGVDAQLFERAAADGKARLGLETVADQIGALDGLPMKEQVLFLRAALDESDGGLADLVAAWQTGDVQALLMLLDAGMGASPGLRRRVLTDRNARWVPQIEAFLSRTSASGQPEDVLVVVGAGHLIGPDSVVEMLRARGLSVERIGE